MSALDRVLGRKLNETTTTGDIAPVMASVPAWQHIKRNKDEESRRKKKSSEVAKVVGESQEEGDVIPSDAEEAEDSDFNAAAGVHVPKPKEPKKNPDQAASEEEKLLTPTAALVAPDVTPDSMTEIDPSQVPGKSGGQSFRASDLNAPPQQPQQPGDRTDAAVSQMDILLGRQRSNTPNGPGSPPPTQPVMSEDAAAAIFNQKSGDELLQPGVEVPPPTQGRVDARTVCEAARKFL